MLDNPSIETANNQQLLYYNNDSISKVLIYWNNGIWCYSNVQKSFVSSYLYLFFSLSLWFLCAVKIKV